MPIFLEIFEPIFLEIPIWLAKVIRGLAELISESICNYFLQVYVIHF